MRTILKWLQYPIIFVLFFHTLNWNVHILAQTNVKLYRSTTPRTIYAETTGATNGQQLILARYDNNNVLKQIILGKVDNDSDGCYLTDGVSEFSDDDLLKVFLWDSMDKMNPIIPATACIAKKIEVRTTAQAIFYVATSQNGGSDTNPGTLSQPFATLTKARDAVRTAKSGGMTGDIIVYVREGDYYIDNAIQLTDADSGTNGYKVIYKNYDAVGSARFIGGQSITNWTVYSGNIYRAQVGMGRIFYTLYENSRRGRVARYPNVQISSGYEMAQAPYLSSEGVDTSKTVLQYKQGDMDPSQWDLSRAQVYIWSGGKWDWLVDLDPISSVDTATRQIMLQNPTTYAIYNNTDYPGIGSRYFIQNSLNLLDQPGEFYLDSATGYLYYWPYDSNNLTNGNIIAPKVRQIISITGTNETCRVANISFDGLTFQATDFTNSFSHGVSTEYGMMDLKNTNNIEILNSRFINAGFHAVNMNGYNQYNTVSGCLMSQMGMRGIYLLGKDTGHGDVLKYNVLTNNLIHDVGELIGHSSGISIARGNNNEISYSEIYNSPRYAVSISGPWNVAYNNSYNYNNTVKYLNVHNCAQDSGDGAGIYSMATCNNTAAPFRTNTYDQILISNIRANPSIHDTPPDGLYMDAQAWGQSISNIEITNIQRYPFFTNSSSHTFNNVTWTGNFNTALMDYGNIGIKSSFPYKSEVKNDGNILAFDMQDPGSSIDDKSVYGNNGSVTGANRVMGPGRYVRDFNGTSGTGYITVPQSSGINDIPQVSYEAWICCDAVGASGRLFSKNEGQGNMAFLSNKLLFNQGFSAQGGQWSTGSYSIPNGQWTHVVITYDKSSYLNQPAFYVNGVKRSTTIETAPSGTANSDANSDLWIGNRSDKQRPFDGRIASFKIYNKVLSQSEVLANYNQDSAAFSHATLSIPSGNVLNYDMQDAGLTITDYSGNSNNGTMISNIARIPGPVMYVRDFSGAAGGNCITVPKSSSINDLAQASYEAWVYLDDDGRLFAKNDTAGRAAHIGANGKITFYKGFSTTGGIWFSTNPPLSSSQWAHVVITYDSTSASNKPMFYINGVPNAVSTQAAPSGTALTDSDNDLIIFNREDKQRPINGKLGTFRVYNRILNAAEVLNNYNTEKWIYGL